MRRLSVAFFLALQLAGCASRPAGPADPGPPILITEDMDLESEPESGAAAKSSAPVADELLESLRQKLLEPPWGTFAVPGFLINAYLWNVFVPRPDSAPTADRYNPAFTADRDQAYRGDEATAELATQLWQVSRSPESLRRNFAAHKQWLYAALPQVRYKTQGLDTYVDELLRVEAHLFKSADAPRLLRELRARLARGKRGGGGYAFPGRSNSHRVAYFGELYDKGAAQRIIARHCPSRTPECTTSSADMALWLHTFWYRRNLEQNREATSKILREIQAHYK